MGKCYARSEVKINRLYIKIARKLTKKDLDNLYTDIRFCVADLEPGFDVITDLSECTIATLNGVSTFKKIANYLIENQVGTVIRVMNDDSIVFRQFINLTSRTQGYKPIIVSTLEEAELELSEAAKRSAPRFHLFKQPVELRGAEYQGTGMVIDISASGCAVKSKTSLPKVGEELSFTISFSEHQDFVSEFVLPSKVVKVEKGWFAVHFISVEEKIKDDLGRRLVYESKCELQP